jgi:hypothetical protein
MLQCNSHPTCGEILLTTPTLMSHLHICQPPRWLQSSPDPSHSGRYLAVCGKWAAIAYL